MSLCRVMSRDSDASPPFPNQPHYLLPKRKKVKRHAIEPLPEMASEWKRKRGIEKKGGWEGVWLHDRHPFMQA
jgi:hypothetical protein